MVMMSDITIIVHLSLHVITQAPRAGLQEAGHAVASRQVPGRGGQEGGREEIYGHCSCQGGSLR